MNRKIVIFSFALIIILGIRFAFFYRGRQAYSNGQALHFSATLLTQPQTISNKQHLIANLPNGEEAYVATDLNNSFNYGDVLDISGTLKSQLLKSGARIWTISNPKITVKSSALNSIGLVRKNIISLFENTLSQKDASLLLGIVFGIKEQMPKNFLDELRNAGVLHVVAASGMNVVMVGGFLSSIFLFFLKRQLALVATIFGIIFYAVLAGLEPSIVRASIMGILVFSSQILGRQNSAHYALFLTGFIMLFISPILLGDVGFQLSFTATIGLLIIRPIFETKKIKPLIEKSLVGEDIATTLSAQAATLPILVSVFGTYSLWSIVANALVLWTIPPLMILGGIGAILGFISGWLGQIFITLCVPLLVYFEKIVSIFGNSSQTFSVNYFPWQITVGYYILLLSAVLFIRRKLW